MARGRDRRARSLREIPIVVHKPEGCELCGSKRWHRHTRAEWSTLTKLTEEPRPGPGEA